MLTTPPRGGTARLILVFACLSTIVSSLLWLIALFVVSDHLAIWPACALGGGVCAAGGVTVLAVRTLVTWLTPVRSFRVVSSDEPEEGA